MHRFYCNILERNGVLNEEESYHAIKVLRLNVGEKVTCFDGKGHEWLCVIESLRSDGSSSKHPLIKLKIEKEKYFPTNVELKRPSVSLVVSIFKFDRLEFGIEKVVELGVDEIIFTKTKLSQFDLGVAEKKLSRWNEIVISACKQSERKYIPTLKIEKFEDLIKEKNNSNNINNTDSELNINNKELRLVATTELKDAKKITEYLDNQTEYEKIYIWIGPEGGFSNDELETITKIYLPVRISGNILRAETAMMKAISYFRF